MDEIKKKRCIICKQWTTGSVGVAGIRWSIICQPCKDREDNEYAKIISNVIDSVDMICKCLKGE